MCFSMLLDGENIWRCFEGNKNRRKKLLSNVFLRFKIKLQTVNLVGLVARPVLLFTDVDVES